MSFHCYFLYSFSTAPEEHLGLGPCGQPGDSNIQCWSVYKLPSKSQQAELIVSAPLTQNACRMVFVHTRLLYWVGAVTTLLAARIERCKTPIVQKTAVGILGP